MTTVVAVVTIAVSIVGFVAPALRAVLERRPGALGRGEEWRLVTSLLVHPNVVALVANVVLLLVVGIALERRVPPSEWLTLYLGAGVLAQLPGLAWDPHDSGNSVAIFGLVGGLAVLAIRKRQVPLWSIGYAAFALVALLAMDAGGIPGLLLWLVAAVTAGMLIRWWRAQPLAAVRAVAAVIVAEGIVLCLLTDVHGPAVLVGVVIAALWPSRRTTDLRAGEPPSRSSPPPHRRSRVEVEVEGSGWEPAAGSERGPR
jgi:rhomboid protease GluP